MLQDFWDQQYQFSRIIPDFNDLIQRMGEESALFAETREFERSYYGAHARQWVEWTNGQGTGTLLPVILHGGYWRALSAQDSRFMMAPWLEQSPHVANIEYRLMPEVRLGDVIQDARQAVETLAKRFPELQMILIGHSAGAHLALSVLEDSSIAAHVAGVIALSGIYDLAPITQCFLQSEIALTPQEVSAYSLAPSADRPPVLYVTGSAETHESLRASALMASQGRAAWHLIEGANHLTLTWAAGEALPELLFELLKLESRR